MGIAAREMGGSSAPEMGLALRLEILFLEIIQRHGLQIRPPYVQSQLPPRPLGRGCQRQVRGYWEFFSFGDRCARNVGACAGNQIGASLGNGRLEIMCTASAVGATPTDRDIGAAPSALRLRHASL